MRSGVKKTLDDRVRVIEKHLRAENAHDIDAIMATFGEHPTFRLNGTLHSDRDSIISMYDGLGFGEKGYFSDLKAEAKQQHVTEDSIVLELLLSGRHTADWQGLRATGRTFEIPACAVFEFDKQGTLAAERVYFDSGLLRQQLTASA